jgi:hypothetical protein
LGTYQCHACGQLHDGPPTAYGADAPIYWYGLEEPERSRRFDLGTDTAVLDDGHFFIRGQIELPILGKKDPFAWSVWITMGRDSFALAMRYWDVPGRENILEPVVGFISTALPVYPDTVNLKGRIHTRPVGTRPSIELEPTDHPLAVEQRTGITWRRVEDIAVAVLHRS